MAYLPKYLVSSAFVVVLALGGSEVYELIAPGGKVYVMQSYAHIVDDTLDEAALPSLGKELQNTYQFAGLLK